MKYFDKPAGLMPLTEANLDKHYLHNAKQMFDQVGNQNPSAAFSMHYLCMVRESYRATMKMHPKSVTKRQKYLHHVYPIGVSIYRNPSRFLRFYLYRTGGVLIGDPTGRYYLPVNTTDPMLEFMPHPFPNALADRFTLSILKYLIKPPSIRYVRKDTKYGYVEMSIPSFVYLDENGKMQRFNFDETECQFRTKTPVQYFRYKLTGYISEWEIREYLITQLKWYIKYHRETMDESYYRFLQQHPLIGGNI